MNSKMKRLSYRIYIYIRILRMHHTGFIDWGLEFIEYKKYIVVL